MLTQWGNNRDWEIGVRISVNASIRPDDFKQLLDEVFVISGITKAEAGNPRPLLFRISQKPNVILMIVSILYIVLRKITTNTPSQGTPARAIYSTE